MSWHLKHHQSLIGDKCKILAHVSYRKTRNTVLQEVFGKQRLAFNRLFYHLEDTSFELGIEQFRLFATDGVNHFIGKRHVRALVAKHPVSACGKSIQQSTRPQEINVCKRCEKEQSFDANRKTDQVQQKVSSVIWSSQFVQ